MPYLCQNLSGAASSLASTYDGYLYNKDKELAGTIQVKVGKPNRTTGLASVKATVIGLDGRKRRLKAAEWGKAAIRLDGPTEIELVGGEACAVTLGANGMSGTYGNYAIDGALNVFASRSAADRETARTVLGKWQGAVNMAWEGTQGWNGLSVTIASKGKAKVSGTLASGVKVTANSQLLVGEDWCCVPVLVKKKAQMAFVLWLRRDGSAPAVLGLPSAVVGRPGTLKAGAKFRMAAPLGDERYADFLPDGASIDQYGTRWMVLPGAGRILVVQAGTGSGRLTGTNPSGLRLTYKAKDGTFKGTFKVYVDMNGRTRATTVNVAGVLVDGIGYGTAVVKKAGGVAVTIE